MDWDEHYRRLERMYRNAPVNGFFRPALSVAKGRAEVRIGVRPEFFHAASAVHGAVYFKAMDDAAFFAANSLLRDYLVLTVGFNLYLTRPISEGEMVAQGQVVHQSRRLLLAEAELVDAHGRQIGRGSGSFMPTRIRLDPQLGYR